MMGEAYIGDPVKQQARKDLEREVYRAWKSGKYSSPDAVGRAFGIKDARAYYIVKRMEKREVVGL